VSERAGAGRLVGPLVLDLLHRGVELEHAMGGLGAHPVAGGREAVRVQYLRAAPVRDPDLVQRGVTADADDLIRIGHGQVFRSPDQA
jgi:hypothetical protein